MLVVTVDQRDSRHDIDRIDGLLDHIDGGRSLPSLVRPFERTAGDEVQGLLAGHDDVCRLALDLVRDGHWNVGIGLGSVNEPIPASVRAAAGEAFVHARDAVVRAKASPRCVAVTGPDASLAGDAEALLALLAAIVQRRSQAGWEVVDLVAAGMTQQEAAKILGISAQAVSQRLQAALWRDEERARPVAGRLLREADA
jgi:DNA-directed RNA polymerase specialized sigma24 family protein